MPDNVIQGPWAKAPPTAEKPSPVPPPTNDGIDVSKLSLDRQKAIQIAATCPAFVCIGIKPTDAGADFFTACDGEPADLRNAQDHLPAVIGRLFAKKGITS